MIRRSLENLRAALVTPFSTVYLVILLVRFSRRCTSCRNVGVDRLLTGRYCQNIDTIVGNLSYTDITLSAAKRGSVRLMGTLTTTLAEFNPRCRHIVL